MPDAEPDDGKILRNTENLCEKQSTGLVILKFAFFWWLIYSVNRMKNKLILILQSSKLEYN